MTTLESEFASSPPSTYAFPLDLFVLLMTSKNVYFIASFIPLIMEYLVNISKRRAFWSLNEDILKITILKTNTPYPSRKIRRIRACIHQRPQRNKTQYAVSKRSQYAVLEIWNEYNILEDIKCGPYSKKSPIRRDLDNSTSNVLIPLDSWTSGLLVYKLPLSGVNDDLYDLRSMEAEFPTIVIDDAFTPQDALPCKSQNEFPAIVYNDAQTSKSDLLTESILSAQHIDEFNLNDETSVSEYDEEEQNILYFNDLFPFNIIRPDNLKSKKDNNDNDIDMIQSSEGNEITHRSNMLMDTSSDKIDKIFDKESFVLELNMNIVTWIYLFNGMLLYFIMNLYVPFGIPFDPKRYYKDGDYSLMLRRPMYQGLEYTDEDIADFEERFERIYSKKIHKVHVVAFQGMPKLMRDGLFARMVMEHRDDAGVVVFTSRAWGRLFNTRGPLVRELILKFLSTLRFGEFILALGLHTGEEMESPSFARYWSESERMIPGKEDLHNYWRGISTDGDFLGPPPSYTLIRDPVLRLCHRMMAHRLDVGSVNIPYLLARYLRRFTAGRKSGAHIFGGQFVARLTEHFGLLTAEILGGLTVIASELPIIDMDEMVRLQICIEIDDTWAWVSMGPERQPDVAAGSPAVAEDAPAVDEGDQAILVPVQATQ
ncbi:hypothetical protein Tco_0521830 [Tanacetum coccineum]